MIDFLYVLSGAGTPQEEMNASLHVGSHPNTISVLGSVKDRSHFGLILSVLAPSYKSLGGPPSFKTGIVHTEYWPIFFILCITIVTPRDVCALSRSDKGCL